MEKNITIESIRNKSYEEMSREEKQFFCENAHLLCEDTQEDNGIIIVDDIDSYISKRNLVNVSELENEQSTWNDQQWWQFFSRGGTLTHEEFCLKLDKIIQDVYGD